MGHKQGLDFVRFWLNYQQNRLSGSMGLKNRNVRNDVKERPRVKIEEKEKESDTVLSRSVADGLLKVKSEIDTVRR
jgi:hypothetical protein